MAPSSDQPDQRPRRASRTPLAVVSGVAALIGLVSPGRAAADPPAADSRPLVVWVANDDWRGMAIAFNEIKDADRQNLRYYLPKEGTDWEHYLPKEADWQPAGQSEVLRRLLDDAPMPDVRLTWGNGGRDGPPTSAIEFRFVPVDGLMRCWMPLFLRLADRLHKHHAGCTAKSWSRDGTGPLEEDQPRELSNEDPAWYGRMKADLQNAPDRLLIIGPESSDAVPAIWFALCSMSPDAKSFPPTVSLGATSSLFDYEWEDLVDVGEWKPGADVGTSRTRRMWFPHYSHPDAVRPNWYTSLGRMLGYCEDDLGHATACQQEQIKAVVNAIREPAKRFIQFAASDKVLVETSFAYLHDIQGYRRIGLLYPDPPARAGEDERQLYGPTLREQYQSRAGGISVRDEQVILPAAYLSPAESPVPNPSSRNRSEIQGEGKDREPATGAWEDAAFLKDLANALRPTLRFFRQSGVEAVGVFGSTNARLAVLPLVRAELPDAQLFTSDASWRLESPASAEAPDGTGAGKDGGGASRGTGRTRWLDGLLVFTTSHPPRPWVEAQFVDIGPQRKSREPFLPDTFQLYTAHVVKRLIELEQEKQLWLLTRREGVGELARFIHGQTNLGRRNRQGGRVPVQVPFDDPAIETMIIREGRLGPLADRNHLFLSLGIVALPLIVLASQYFHLRWASRRGQTVPTAQESVVVISPLFYLYYGIVAAAAFVRRRPRPEVSRVQSDWRRWLGNDLLLVSLLVTTCLLLIVGTLAFDGSYSGRPVSWSPWPDGHSVIPSLFLAAAAVVLAHHLPYRFEVELTRTGLVRDPRRRAQALESWILRRWAPPFSPGDLEAEFDDCVKQWVGQDVMPALSFTRREALVTAALAAAFIVVEAAFGMPVSRGVSYPLLLLGEFLVAWVVVSTAWTLYQLSGLPARLSERLQASERLRLGHLDTSSVTRMGSIFIETIAFLLVVLALLVVGRLPEYHMPRWSRFELGGLPLGALLLGVALGFILWYWLYCYTTLKGLIRAVKMDRLDELESIRSTALKPRHIASPSDGPAADIPPKEEDLQKVAEELEKQRRAVEEVSEEPWKVSASWRAWFALGVLLLPPILTALFGSWGETLLRPLRVITGGL